MICYHLSRQQYLRKIVLLNIRPSYTFSVAKATLHSQMSIHLFVCSSVCKNPQQLVIIFLHHSSCFFCHSSFILPSFRDFYAFQLVWLFAHESKFCLKGTIVKSYNMWKMSVKMKHVSLYNPLSFRTIVQLRAVCSPVNIHKRDLFTLSTSPTCIKTKIKALSKSTRGLSFLSLTVITSFHI